MAVTQTQKHEKAPAALEGRLSAVSLFDLCQFLMLNRKTGNLTVRSGTRTAYFTFQDGQVMTALDDSLRDGEAVVLQAVQWLDGSFEFNPGPVAPDRRIEASTENLLLEAARQLDELRADPAMLAADDDGPRVSHQESFRQTQEKAAELSDLFRSAVDSVEAQAQALGWKENLYRILAAGEADRALVSTSGRIHLVQSGLTTVYDGGSEHDVREWWDELWPRNEGSATMRQTRIEGGRCLWAARQPAADGEWLALTVPSPRVPGWEELGLTEDLAHSLAQMDDRALLIGAPTSALAHAALATWLGRRSRSFAEVGWVVEAWPRYDWSALPGKLATYPTSWLRQRGDLSRLADLSGANVLALRGIRSADALRDALELASDGLQVIIAVAGESLPQILRTLELRLGGSDASNFLRQTIGAVWLVRPGPGPIGTPWQSGFLRSPEADPRPAR